MANIQLLLFITFKLRMPEMPLKQLIMLLHYGVLVFSTLKTCRDIYVSKKILSNRVGSTQEDSQFLAVAVMLQCDNGNKIQTCTGCSLH